MIDFDEFGSIVINGIEYVALEFPHPEFEIGTPYDEWPVFIMDVVSRDESESGAVSFPVMQEFVECINWKYIVKPEIEDADTGVMCLYDFTRLSFHKTNTAKEIEKGD